MGSGEIYYSLFFAIKDIYIIETNVKLRKEKDYVSKL